MFATLIPKIQKRSSKTKWIRSATKSAKEDLLKYFPKYIFSEL